LSLGYVDIGLIPKGARDIRVMEIKAAGNFLAIRSEDPEKYYLNGGFIIQWNGNYKLAGTVFQYDRKGDLEKLIAPGPTNESVWLQVILREGNGLVASVLNTLLLLLATDVGTESLCCFFFVL
jgi:thrombospondin motif-containing protein 12